MQNAAMKTINHRWTRRDIVAGNSALDLVNTVSGWNHDAEDWIPDVATFLDWARMGGLLDAQEKIEAVRYAEGRPATVERVLAAIKELRFALWGLMESLEHRKAPRSCHLEVINEWMHRISLSERIIVRFNKVGFAISPDISVLELPGIRVTSAALSLLKSPSLASIKTCPGSDCGWKFVDQSRNGSRRWCDMAVCGNIAKARQYRVRNK